MGRSYKMKTGTIVAISCVVALALSQGTLASECGFVSRRCKDPMRGVNLKGTVLVVDVDVGDCTACITACERHDQCNVWVWCDNPDGCDNGSGGIWGYKTCTLKKQDNIRAIITSPQGSEVAFSPKSGHADGSFKDWVSGYCNICPCCGWCSSAKACCSNYRYCEDSAACVAEQLTPELVRDDFSSNCKDPERDAGRLDCMTHPDGCGAVNPLCPFGSRMFSDVGEEAY